MFRNGQKTDDAQNGQARVRPQVYCHPVGKYKIARVFFTDGQHIIDFMTDASGQWKYEHGPDLARGRTLGMSGLHAAVRGRLCIARCQ